MNGETPSTDDLRDLYRLTLDEYRFQVGLNWQRTQYLLVLNLGIIGVGTGLLGVDSPHTEILTGMIFSIGVLLATFSIAVIRIQHAYYQETRTTKTRLEDTLGISELAPRPTKGMRGLAESRWRAPNVTEARPRRATKGPSWRAPRHLGR